MTEPDTFSAPASPAAHRNGLPHNRLSLTLDQAISATGRTLSWLWLVMLVVVLANVFSRFALSRGSIALEELSWHLFGIAMMMTLSYAVVKDDHVRVDVLREKFSLKTRAIIELLGIALLALPILYLMMEALIPYAWKAFVLDERSQAPSGLPYRFVFKGFLPLGLALVALALFSRLTRCTTLLVGFPRALGGHPDRGEDQ